MKRFFHFSVLFFIVLMVCPAAVVGQDVDKGDLKAFAESYRAEKKQEIKEEKAEQKKEAEAKKQPKIPKHQMAIIKDEVKARRKAIEVLYKKRRYEEAMDQIIDLKRYLYEKDVGEKYEKKTFRKVDTISRKIGSILDRQRKREEKLRAKKERRKEKITKRHKPVEMRISETTKIKPAEINKKKERRTELQLDREKELIQSLKERAKRKRRVIEQERKVTTNELQARIADLYKDAVKLYRNKRYSEAALLFGDIEELSPGYKSADKYLQKLENLQDKPAKNSRPASKRTRRQTVLDALNKHQE